MSPAKPAVYVVDDDPSVRVAMERLLKSVGLTVKTFASAQEFLEQTTPEWSGCLIVDLRMPGMGGLDLQDQLSARQVSLPVIFLTGYGTVPASVRAMKAGAVDFLEKPVDDQTLLDAVHKGLERDRGARLNQAEIQVLRQRLATLTPREYEVLTFIISGRLNKQAAAELGTTEKTIKVHRARIMEKLQCASLVELVRLAEKAGIKTLD
ncbi:MAG TPA: response regulator transcription factor [Desulfobaccales bacterium]|nr:response regulator transcription factor [Desulfobaccales bacterium]